MVYCGDIVDLEICRENLQIENIVEYRTSPERVELTENIIT